MSTNLYTLFQVIDSSFPIGSYTQSFGLETYVQKQLITDREALFEYVKNLLNHNLIYSDGLALRLVYENLSMEYIKKIDEILTASKLARESREGSQRLGKRFIKTVLDFEEVPLLSRYLIMINEKAAAGHHAVAFAVYANAMGIEKEEAIKSYLFAQIMGTIINCTKLVPLSQRDGQKVLRQTHEMIDEAYMLLDTLEEADLGTNFPGYDIRCMQHENLYSRLYMS